MRGLLLAFRNMRKLVFTKNYLIPFGILIIGIVFTVLASKYTIIDVQNSSNREFALVCNEVKTKITTRLYSHAQLLRSGSSFFAASDTVTRNTWKLFYDKSKINKNLPGIQGVGFSVIIPKNKLNQHIQQVRNEGFADFNIYPTGDRPIYTSIIFIEPFSGRNLRAFGYDMYSEPIRRKAMDRACDYDLAALSGKVVLVQENDKDRQAGSLMYVPVYQNGMPTTTIKQRRAAIIGWVYSPYRMSDLMKGILGTRDLKDRNNIHLQIYDNDEITPQSLLYDSKNTPSNVRDDKANHTLIMPIVFNGKQWTLVFSQSKDQFSYFHENLLLVFFSCVVISLLLFALSILLLNTRKRAEQIALRLTSELKESETRFSLFMDHLPAIVFIKDNEGRALYVNKYMDDKLGASNWLGKNMFEIYPNDFGAKILADDLRVLQKGFEKIEENIMQLDGQFHYYETQKFSIPREGDEPYLGGIAIDISERIQSEKNLRIREERYRNLFDRANEGLILLSMDGKIVELNESFAKMHGYTIDEMKNMDIKDLDVLREDAFEGRNDVMQRLYAGAVVRFEVEHYHKKGHSFLLSDTVSIITVDNEQFFLAFHQDITERKQAEKELKESREQLRNYASHLQYVREKERFSITLEIHDSLAQFLVALKFDMGMYKKKILNANETIDTEELIKKMDDFMAQTDKTIKSARSIMNGLRPEQLELLGFVAATEVHLRDFEETHHIECVFTNKTKDPVIQPEQALGLFRILQECLNNILKHAMANLVTVELSEKKDYLLLQVTDNGVGFDKNNCGRPDSYGLIGMKEQVSMLSGKFNITSKVGEGTKVSVEIPKKLVK